MKAIKNFYFKNIPNTRYYSMFVEYKDKTCRKIDFSLSEILGIDDVEYLQEVIRKLLIKPPKT